MSIVKNGPEVLADLRTAYPIGDCARELIMCFCKFLMWRSFESWPNDPKIKEAIDELLNYLPEVQFYGDELQEVIIDGHEYRFWRKRPTRPLMNAIYHAEEFDTFQSILLRVKLRYLRAIGVIS